MTSFRRFSLGLLVSFAVIAVAACSSDDHRPSSSSGGDGGDASGAGGGATGVGGSGSASSSTSGSSSGGVDPEPDPLKGITALHNAARASVDPPATTPLPPLSWSPAVADAAKAHAAKCVFEHSGNGYGENIYASSGASTPDNVVSSWVSEVADYDYASNSCSGVCGHYTQVVWAKSLNLGCAFQACSMNSPLGGGSWEFWVCDYDPPGNYNGEKPY